MAAAIFGLAFIALLDVAPVAQVLFIFSDPLTLEFGFGVVAAAVVRRGMKGGVVIYFLGAAIAFVAGAWLAIHAQPLTVSMRVMTFGAGAWLLIYAVVAAELHGMRFPPAAAYLGNISIPSTSGTCWS
jgi:exopolysaccharide production protein ExoZ